MLMMGITSGEVFDDLVFDDLSTPVVPVKIRMKSF